MGNIELVRRMLKSPNFNINAKDINGRTPLYIAAKEGFTIELLIKSSATVDVLGYEKMTALHEAALNAKYQAVEILLKYGAQVDSKGWGEDITRFGHNDKGTLYNTPLFNVLDICVAKYQYPYDANPDDIVLTIAISLLLGGVVSTTLKVKKWDNHHPQRGLNYKLLF